MSVLQEKLEALFAKKRVVFWYDEEKGCEEDFAGVEIAGVRKLRFEANPFELKRQMLLDGVQEKFLLYWPEERPADADHWLLDVELIGAVFRNDEEAAILTDLGLDESKRGWVQRHIEFLKGKERKERLAKRLLPEDGEEILSLRIAQTVMSADDADVQSLLNAAFNAWALEEEKADRWEADLHRFGVAETFWHAVGAKYGYYSDAPDLSEFIQQVFEQAFPLFASRVNLNPASHNLRRNWQYHAHFQDAFEAADVRMSEVLNVPQNATGVDIDSLKDVEVFQAVDDLLVNHLISSTLEEEHNALDEVRSVAAARQNRFWGQQKAGHYHALVKAVELLQKIQSIRFPSVNASAEAIQWYTTKGYAVDQLYREFLVAYEATSMASDLEPVKALICRAYSASWLDDVMPKWQRIVDANGADWLSTDVAQRHFFQFDVGKYARDKQRIFVIISDGLRYEGGVGMHEALQSANRFVSEIWHRAAGLPTYTQLGMAALLPNQDMMIKADGAATVAVDGKSSVGLDGRGKILALQGKKQSLKTKVISAETVVRMNTKSQEAMELVQNHDIVYIYHNEIDETGEHAEHRTMEAVSRTIEDLTELTTKLFSMNVNHVLVTSDHGFLYQDEAIEESDFCRVEVQGDVIKKNRRFVLGSGLSGGDSCSHFTAVDLKLKAHAGAIEEVLIPKGANRLRHSGGGSRYVHGGASLQEVVVPVLHVSKKRKDTVSHVEVDAIRPTVNVISSFSPTVKFYQKQPVAPGRVGADLKAHFEALDPATGQVVPLCTPVQRNFGSDSEEAKEREQSISFPLDNRLKRSHRVELVILLSSSGQDKWKEVDRQPYELNIAQDRDF